MSPTRSRRGAPKRICGPNAFSIAPEVVIDNSLSNVYTVIEVSGLDREGLLFELTNAISQAQLSISLRPMSSTFGERAVDAFYVTDLTGGKIVSPSRQATIKRQLLEVFSGSGRKARSQGSRPPPGDLIFAIQP